MKNKILKKFKKLEKKIIYFNKKNKIIKKIKSLFSNISLSIFNKILEILSLIWAFLILIIIYYFITWISYNSYSNQQIESFIFKEIPKNSEYYIEKYFYDFKWFGNKSLVIISHSKMKNVYKWEFWQVNASKIYIFDEKQKNPIERLLFDSKIYKKEFEFEFQINNLNNKFILEEWDLFKKSPYHMSKGQIFLNKIIPIKYNNRNILILNWNMHFWIMNAWQVYYGILSYNYWKGYKINWLIDSSDPIYNESSYNENYKNKENNQNSLFWARNIKVPWIINWKLEKVEFTKLLTRPSYIKFYNNKLNFNLYLHNLEECYGSDIIDIPWECSYISLKYFYNDSSNNYINIVDNIEYIKKGTKKHNQIKEYFYNTDKLWKQ